MIPDALSALGTCGPQKLHVAGDDAVLDQLVELLAPLSCLGGLFLLDSRSGVFSRRTSWNWPATLADLRFSCGDRILDQLGEGLIQGCEELEAYAPIGLVAPLLDEEGQLRGVLATGTPVDGQAEALIAALTAFLACMLRLGELPREKEALHRYYGEVVEHLHDAVILSDEDGLILGWNEGAQHLLGFGASETVSRCGSFLVPEDDWDQAQEVRSQVASGETIRDLPCVRVQRDGRSCDVLLTGLPVRDLDGDVVGVAEIMRRPERKPVKEARVEREPTREEPWEAEAETAVREDAQTIAGAHPRMVKLRGQVQRYAPLASGVMILGETGTGKELVAKMIHRRSPRGSQPFSAINCAAIPRALLESELFGYERGAFTGADRQKKGLLENANGGTVLLDEVAEMPLDLQVKLLRLLQEKAFRRLGGSEEISLDVRFLAATNRPIRRHVDEGRFREDLYYRLNVLNVDVPPLRERLSDIPLLACHGLRRISAENGNGHKVLAGEALGVLMEHSWPGNVRELLNVLERACALEEKRTIGAGVVRSCLSDLHPGLRRIYDGDVRLSLEDVERRHITNVLAETGGNVRRAAAILGISRDTVYKKMKRYGLR